MLADVIRRIHRGQKRNGCLRVERKGLAKVRSNQLDAENSISLTLSYSYSKYGLDKIRVHVRHSHRYSSKIHGVHHTGCTAATKEPSITGCGVMHRAMGVFSQRHPAAPRLYSSPVCVVACLCRRLSVFLLDSPLAFLFITPPASSPLLINIVCWSMLLDHGTWYAPRRRTEQLIFAMESEPRSREAIHLQREIRIKEKESNDGVSRERSHHANASKLSSHVPT